MIIRELFNIYRLHKSSVLILIFRGGALALSLIQIAIISRSLEPLELAFWLTLSSLVSWFSLCDLGIANAYRNRLAQSLSRSKFRYAKKLSSSVYLYFLVIIITLYSICMLLIPFLELSEFFRLEKEYNIYKIFMLMLGATLINIYGNVNASTAHANDLSELDAIRHFIYQLIIILILTLIFPLNDSIFSLEQLSLFYFISSIIANISVYIFLKSVKKSFYIELESADLKCFSSLFKESGSFFIMQLSAILLYATDTVLITRLFGLEDVSYFNLANKIFFIFIFAQSAILSPYWSSYTKLYSNKDSDIIKRKLLSSIRITSVLIIICATVSFVIDEIISLWTGGNVIGQVEVTIALFLLTSLRLWCSNFSTFLNGCGILRTQLIASVFAMLSNIAFSILLVKEFGFGPEGVAYGSFLALLAFGVLGPISTRRVILKLMKES